MTIYLLLTIGIFFEPPTDTCPQEPNSSLHQILSIAEKATEGPDLEQSLEIPERLKGIISSLKLKKKNPDEEGAASASDPLYVADLSGFQIEISRKTKLSNDELADLILEMLPTVQWTQDFRKKHSLPITESESILNKHLQLDLDWQDSMVNAFAHEGGTFIFYGSFKKIGLDSKRIAFIISHELGHHIFADLTSGDFELPQTEFNRALNEAFADTIAYFYSGETDLYIYPNQVERKLKNDYDYDFFQAEQETHGRSQVISGLFHDLDQKLGNEKFQKLLTRAIQIYSNEWWRNKEVQEFRSLRVSLLKADQELFNSADESEINALMDARSIPARQANATGPRLAVGSDSIPSNFKNRDLYLSPDPRSFTYLARNLADSRSELVLETEKAKLDSENINETSFGVGAGLVDKIIFDANGEPYRLLSSSAVKKGESHNVMTDGEIRLEMTPRGTLNFEVLNLNDQSLKRRPFLELGVEADFYRNPIFVLVPSPHLQDQDRALFSKLSSDIKSAYEGHVRIETWSATELQNFKGLKFAVEKIRDFFKSPEKSEPESATGPAKIEEQP